MGCILFCFWGRGCFIGLCQAERQMWISFDPAKDVLESVLESSDNALPGDQGENVNYYTLVLT